MDDSIDVVVVGAGPTGLTVAGDLAEAGVRVRVLERRVHESNLTRAFAVHARTLEQFDARGLADELAESGAHVRRLRLFDRVALDLGQLPSRYNYVLITPQYQTERLLQRRLDQLGVEVTRGVEMTDLTQDDDGVQVRARTTEGAALTYRAAYVVGADGVGSRVRSALGLPFPGKAVLKSIMLADVRLTESPKEVLAVNGVGDGFAFVAPFGDGWYRVFAWDRRKQADDTAPLDLEEVRGITRRALGTDFGMHDPRWISRFHSDERQVPDYRVGRVFLTGDAAHAHSPAGGQGMNTGIQDAANLGWKLAAAVQGRGSAELLDSYHAERHPVGTAVLRSSGALIRMVMIRSAPGRALRNAAVAKLLRRGVVARRVLGEVSGLGFHYPAPRGSHAATGHRAADLPTAGGGRLYEALRGGRFVFASPVADPGPWPADVVAVTPVDRLAPTTLVRPDGYVAWASDERDPHRLREQGRAAVRRWCQSPSVDARGAGSTS